MKNRENKKNKMSLIVSALAAAVLAGAVLLEAQDGGFRFRGPLGRVLTPNGDGLNDAVLLCLDNPSGSGVEGKIFSLWGSQVSVLGPPQSAAGTACPQDSPVPNGPQFLSWDGKSGGTAVRSGIYVFSVKAEGRGFSGTLLVVR